MKLFTKNESKSTMFFFPSKIVAVKDGQKKNWKFKKNKKS